MISSRWSSDLGAISALISARGPQAVERSKGSFGHGTQWGMAAVEMALLRQPALGGAGIALLVCGIGALGFISGGAHADAADALDTPLVDGATSVQEAGLGEFRITNYYASANFFITN